MPATPKNIRTGADTAEATRIFDMAPTAMKTDATTLAPLLQGVTNQQVVAGVVVDFQTFISYGLTSTYVTEADVDSYVRTRSQEYSNARSGISAYRLTHLRNGNVKTLLMTYFGIQPSTMSSAALEQGNLVNALGVYRDNLLEYKLSGNAAYKSAADGAKAWLDQYLRNLNLQVNRTADEISKQVSTYQSANPEMTQIQSDFQRVKVEGPKAEDTYQTIRRQMAQPPPPSTDTTNLYIKGGVAIGLVLSAVVLSLF